MKALCSTGRLKLNIVGADLKHTHRKFWTGFKGCVWPRAYSVLQAKMCDYYHER